jgi:hypothetical protein
MTSFPETAAVHDAASGAVWAKAKGAAISAAAVKVSKPAIFNFVISFYY